MMHQLPGLPAGLITEMLVLDDGTELVHLAQRGRSSIFVRAPGSRRYRRVGPRGRGASWDSFCVTRTGLYIAAYASDEHGFSIPSLCVIEGKRFTSPAREIGRGSGVTPVRLLCSSPDGSWLFLVHAEWTTAAGTETFIARIRTDGSGFTKLCSLSP